MEKSDDYEDDEPLITLYFEPIYGEKISDIPNTVYHVTDLSNVENIKLKGLLPKNTNKISYHPRRVYLLTKEEDAEDLIENFKFKIDNPVILTIDITNIKDNLNFYKDIIYPKGVFIDQRISPKYIINYKRVN
jgi:RNA:NAD 2'-phosphotransferase (TPT1/KptA family)